MLFNYISLLFHITFSAGCCYICSNGILMISTTVFILLLDEILVLHNPCVGKLELGARSHGIFPNPHDKVKACIYQVRFFERKGKKLNASKPLHGFSPMGSNQISSLKGCHHMKACNSIGKLPFTMTRLSKQLKIM
ncbi:hypothetical protein L6164_016410 [Bauhinia variegata]|uniref:Uncharacterized protein n=1 Tax=Bauhinia variegata TaxID=167791 RepID=A0ACB9NSX2_BAUVA|nr:hypothetical protein L6164_016410 [Bauhinia variegata]